MTIPATGAPGTRVAVLLPAYNEEVAVAKVVRDFRRVLPSATIYVFDNNSRDRTSERAREAGAVVVASRIQGKGAVVRHMFAEVEADIYVMADADDTYPAEYALKLIEEMGRSEADMVVGTRLTEFGSDSFRRFHLFGNRMFSKVVASLFGATVTDILSGYRVFSRRFVKSVPLRSTGFDIETELTLQAASKGFALREVPITYGERPEDSHSKLRTYSDGFLILKRIARLLKDHKPLLFFSVAGGFCFLLSLACGAPAVLDYLRHHYVYHIPLAILAAALAILAVLLINVGLILDSVYKYHLESFDLWMKLSERSITPGATTSK